MSAIDTKAALLISHLENLDRDLEACRGRPKGRFSTFSDRVEVIADTITSLRKDPQKVSISRENLAKIQVVRDALVAKLNLTGDIAKKKGVSPTYKLPMLWVCCCTGGLEYTILDSIRKVQLLQLDIHDTAAKKPVDCSVYTTDICEGWGPVTLDEYKGVEARIAPVILAPSPLPMTPFPPHSPLADSDID